MMKTKDLFPKEFTSLAVSSNVVAVSQMAIVASKFKLIKIK